MYWIDLKDNMIINFSPHFPSKKCKVSLSLISYIYLFLYTHFFIFIHPHQYINKPYKYNIT